MDCFFHAHVPSVAPCRGCKKPLCASCRNENGDCPACVMAARIDAARQTTRINGGVGPSHGTYAEPPPQPQPQPQPQAQQQYEPPRSHAAPPETRRAAAVAVRPETRALVGLSYPFWPLAFIALLDGKGSLFVKRQAWQALGFNAGMYGLSALLSAAAALPVFTIGAWSLLPFIMPLWIVASIVYGYKVWSGDDIDVPIVSDWVDARLPGSTQPQS